MKQELFRPGFLAFALIGSAVIFAAPMVLDVYNLFNYTVYAAMVILALSLNLVWGIGGILSLGQGLFFGLGGYAYAVTAMNFDSSIGLIFAIIIPTVFALIVGSVLFYGRVSDVYFGVVSLTISLILFNFVNNTSGAGFQIGVAKLGGYNGLPGVPPIRLPWSSQPLDFAQLFVFAALCALGCYLFVRLFVKSAFGRSVIAVRENELRAELLGFDPRKQRLIVFMIGAGMAGLGGAIFASWGAFIGPDIFSVAFAAQAIIWVLFGGLGTLIGPVIGAITISWFSTWLGEARVMHPNIAFGLLFIASVLILPRGVTPAIQSLWQRSFGGAK